MSTLQQLHPRMSAFQELADFEKRVKRAIENSGSRGNGLGGDRLEIVEEQFVQSITTGLNTIREGDVPDFTQNPSTEPGGRDDGRNHNTHYGGSWRLV